MMPVSNKERLLERTLEDLLLLCRESSGVISKVPENPSSLEGFLKKAATTACSLSIYREVLLQRILNSEGALNKESLSEIQRHFILGVGDLESLRPPLPPTDAEEELNRLLSALDEEIGLLDEEAMMVLPSSGDDLGWFLSLCLAVEAQLSWFLSVTLMGRLWPEEPPPDLFEGL